MGLVTGLLTLPLAPVRGVVWVAEQVRDQVEEQLYDEGRLRGELLQLELDSDDGLLSDDERAAREEELFERLSVARARRSENHGFQQQENVNG